MLTCFLVKPQLHDSNFFKVIKSKLKIMITTSNYIEKTRDIDFDKLSVELKNGDKFAQRAAENNWSSYHSFENVKRAVDKYFKMLDEELETQEPVESEKSTEKNEKSKVESKKSTVKSEKSKAESNPDSHREAKEKKQEPKAKKPGSKKTEPEQEPEGVEKILPEVGFIKRYVGLHGKIKTQDDILKFLASLQKAILEKRIRKTSPYAKEIENIQNQLIKCYEKMGNNIEITLDKTTLDRYTEIAHSQKILSSVLYIKQYISLYGKKNVKEKAEILSARIKKAVDKHKTDKSDPYADRLQKLYNSLNEYINGKTKSPEISKSELNGLMGLIGYSQKKSTALNGIEEESENPEIISSTDLVGMEFKTIGLQGKYRELIGDPSIGFSAMVYGLPKSGKSTLCIDFAKYLAEHHGKVLYVAIEEKVGYLLKEKVVRLKASHPNLDVSGTIPKNLSDYDFVFIDSVSRANLTMDDLRRLRQDNPKTAFIFIYHTTKEGNFRGKQENAHEVDVIIEVADGKAKGNGRFGIGESIDVF